MSEMPEQLPLATMFALPDVFDGDMGKLFEKARPLSEVSCPFRGTEILYDCVPCCAAFEVRIIRDAKMEPRRAVGTCRRLRR